MIPEPYCFCRQACCKMISPTPTVGCDPMNSIDRTLFAEFSVKTRVFRFWKSVLKNISRCKRRVFQNEHEMMNRHMNAHIHTNTWPAALGSAMTYREWWRSAACSIARLENDGSASQRMQGNWEAENDDTVANFVSDSTPWSLGGETKERLVNFHVKGVQ